MRSTQNLSSIKKPREFLLGAFSLVLSGFIYQPEVSEVAAPSCFVAILFATALMVSTVLAVSVNTLFPLNSAEELASAPATHPLQERET